MNYVEIVVPIVVAFLGSGFLSAIVSNHIAHKNKDTAVEKAVMFLMASEIRSECQEHINKDEIGADDLERLEAEWKLYHDDLKGNGFLNTYMHDIRNLSKSKTI